MGYGWIVAIFQRIYGKTMSLRDFHHLLTPFAHSSLLARRRSEMIISRVRVIAMMFAILTPLWVVIDAFFLPWPLWGWISLQRIMVSLAFWLLVWLYPQTSSIKDAYRALALLFIIPSLFYITSNMTLVDSTYSLYGNPALTGYAFLPFVMLAGMSVFPLTLMEGVLFASPAVVAQFLSIVFEFSFGSIGWGSEEQLATVWLLFLIAGVANLAGISQLHLMHRLTHQASRDPLTGCFNRASGEELLNIHFYLSKRSQKPLSLVFFDLDNFKEVNDKYGHEAGDDVLQMASSRIRQGIRTGDMLIRWGGEEFLVLLPETPVTGAVQLVERLRVQGLGQRPDGMPLTASIGVADNLSGDVPHIHALVELADHRMYLAKKAGKNCVVSEN